MISATLVAALALFFGYSWFARWRMRNLKAIDDCHATFYKAARNLVKDPDTPKEVLDLTGFLSANLRNAALLRSVVREMLKPKLPETLLKRKERQGLIKVIGAMPQRLQHLLGQVVVSGLFAMTHESILVGMVVRRLVLFGVWLSRRAREQKLNESAVDLAEKMHCYARVR
jgi:hypothetical protein